MRVAPGVTTWIDGSGTVRRNVSVPVMAGFVLSSVMKPDIVLLAALKVQRDGLYVLNRLGPIGLTVNELMNVAQLFSGAWTAAEPYSVPAQKRLGNIGSTAMPE